MRVDKLRTFGDYLCGIEPPLLSYDVETHKYVSVAPASGDNAEPEPDPLNKSLESEGSKVGSIYISSDYLRTLNILLIYC